MSPVSVLGVSKCLTPVDTWRPPVPRRACSWHFLKEPQEGAQERLNTCRGGAQGQVWGPHLCGTGPTFWSWWKSVMHAKHSVTQSVDTVSTSVLKPERSRDSMRVGQPLGSGAGETWSEFLFAARTNSLCQLGFGSATADLFAKSAL